MYYRHLFKTGGWRLVNDAKDLRALAEEMARLFGPDQERRRRKRNAGSDWPGARLPPHE